MPCISVTWGLGDPLSRWPRVSVTPCLSDFVSVWSRDVCSRSWSIFCAISSWQMWRHRQLTRTRFDRLVTSPIDADVERGRSAGGITIDWLKKNSENNISTFLIVDTRPIRVCFKWNFDNLQCYSEHIVCVGIPNVRWMTYSEVGDQLEWTPSDNRRTLCYVI